MAKSADKKDEDILSTMRHRMEIALGAHSENRVLQNDDLKAYGANSDNMWLWPQDVLATRNTSGIDARPCLTVNMLPQHVHQVTNDFRENTPEGDVIPASDDASEDVAEVYEDFVRQIQYDSAADVAYQTAFENTVIMGEAFWRIRTDYESDDSFDQVLKIEKIDNIFSVYMDPSIQDSCGADAEWCFVTDQMSKKDFEAAYPEASTASDVGVLGTGDGDATYWLQDDKVRVVEYFHVTKTPMTLNLYPDNTTAVEGSPEDDELRKVHKKPLASRVFNKKTINWLKTNGFEILERGVWAGTCIPIIRTVGNEIRVDGRIYTTGIIRNAKDAQRMYNYWVSCDAEMLALQPKAPFIGYEGQFDGHEKDWKTANVRNHPYLQVKAVTDDSGTILPLPQRTAPPQASEGLLQAKNGALEDIKATTGQYNADLGDGSAERSGKALMVRQHVGDLGSYHYISNFNRALRHSTSILVDMIPKIYDTARTISTRKLDGSTKKIQLDSTQQDAVREIKDPVTNVVVTKIFNLAKGKYSTEVTTGPGYATKRQEGLAAMTELLQTAPQLWATCGDLVVKNMDWPGAQEISKRIARGIDPKLLADNDDPALQAAQQQIQQMGQEIDQMHHMLMNVSQSIEAREVMIKSFEAQIKARDTEIKAYEAETRRMAALIVPKGATEELTPEQVSDIAIGTLHAAVHSGDIATQTTGLDQLAAQMVQNPAQMAIPGVDPSQGQSGPGGPPAPTPPPQGVPS